MRFAMSEYDAVIVGAGPNGLTAAARLATHGQRVLVLERSATIGGGRGGRGAQAATPAPAPIVGYPRGYTVQVSTDGTNWGKPVVEGKGSGARTIIPLPPTRAKFLRITETESAADAAPWSIRNLRIYEAPAAAARK